MILDNTSPHSTLHIGSPSYGGPSPYVSSATPLVLSASDGQSGVESVAYRIFRLGAPPPDYTTVTEDSTQFTIAGSDGTYEIDTRSTDHLGNVEAVATQFISLDNTPPASTLTT